MPMNAIQYAALYQNLLVKEGNHNRSVPVTAYLSGREATAGKEPMRAAIHKFMHENKKKDPGFIWHPPVPREMFPEVGMFGFYNYEQMCTGLVSCYTGKASPEWLSFILHCAVQFKLSSPDRLDAYAADNLGIDCSGFVGNYVLHVLHGSPGFYTQGHYQGPSSQITDLVRPPYLKRMEDFVPSAIYTLGMIADDGHMPAGGSTAGHKDTGHVMVTVPGTWKQPRPVVVDKFGKLIKTGPGAFAVSVVESRGKVGLGPASDYTFLSVDKDKNFTVFRGGSKSLMRVKVSRVG